MPDGLYNEIKIIADQQGTTISGWFTELAQQRLDADRTSREQLQRLDDAARQADPEGFQVRREQFTARLRAAQQVSARNAAHLRKSDVA